MTGKIDREIFSRAGNYYPILNPAALLNSLFSVILKWHRGCYYQCQTKWRASGRFRMDLTARDPPKVPRCILSGTAGVNKAKLSGRSEFPVRTPGFANCPESLSGKSLVLYLQSIHNVIVARKVLLGSWRQFG